jgi:hypothetical protein
MGREGGRAGSSSRPSAKRVSSRRRAGGPTASSLVRRARGRLAELWSEPAARIVAILVLVVSALTLVVLAQLPASGGRPLQLSSPPIEATLTLSPTSTLFGDPLEARIDVLADASIEPGSIRVRTDFRPYETVSSHVDRLRQGSLSLVSTRVVLSCLTQRCLPSRKALRRFSFPPATILFRRHGRELRVRSAWPGPVSVSSRLGPPSTPARLIERPPELSSGFRISPRLLQITLAALAGLLALAGSLLVARGLWPRFFYSQRRWRRLSPLERALAQVEAAAAIEDEGIRRRTLEQLATRLHESELPHLGREIRAAAWSAQAPRAEALELIARRIRGDLNGSVRR